MSGITGRLGAKTGIIGTTELDYEEGSYTINERQGGISGTSTGYYSLIGKICTVNGYWTPSSNQPSENSLPHIALPFTAATWHGCGAIATDGWDHDGLYSVFTVYPTHNYMRWFCINDHGGWGLPEDNHIGASENLIFSITYKIA